MKKLILPALFVAAIGLSSCSKSFECVCVTTDGSGNTLGQTTTTLEGNKDDVEAACGALSSSVPNSNTDCNIQ